MHPLPDYAQAQSQGCPRLQGAASVNSPCDSSCKQSNCSMGHKRGLANGHTLVLVLQHLAANIAGLLATSSQNFGLCCQCPLRSHSHIVDADSHPWDKARTVTLHTRALCPCLAVPRIRPWIWCCWPLLEPWRLWSSSGWCPPCQG